jgi:hypothetical protein
MRNFRGMSGTLAEPRQLSNKKYKYLGLTPTERGSPTVSGSRANKKCQAIGNSGEAGARGLGHRGLEMKRVMRGPLVKVRPRWQQGPGFGPRPSGMATTKMKE